MLNLLKIKGFFSYVTVVFLNAFVDLGHKITIQNTIFKTCEGDALVMLTAIVNALILLPFILLFTPCGFLADKYPKNEVMRASASAAVILTLLISACYHAGWFWAAFAMTFLLAVQSAFYSPAKYGYIREIAGKDRLARANGLVQATTMIAILAGTFVFSILFERCLSLTGGGAAFANRDELLPLVAPLGWWLVAAAVVALALAWRLPQTKARDVQLCFDWRRYRRGEYLRANLGAVKSHRVIGLCIGGLAVFWAIGQVMLAAFPAFAKQRLGLTDAVTVQGMLACAGIGIMLGSLLAGRLSRNHIETGLIPLGSLGLAGCLFILPMLGSVLAHSLNILLLGFLGGLFIIPLNALIQFHAGERALGRILAANNLIQNAVMLGFLVLTVVFSQQGMAGHLFGLLTLVAAGATMIMLYRLPQSLARLLASVGMGWPLRLAVRGLGNMPEAGGVLLKGNAGDWLGWAITQTASPRPLRLIIQADLRQAGRPGFMGVLDWFLRRFLGRFALPPIANGKGTQQAVWRALRAGEAVCLLGGQEGDADELYALSANGADCMILPFYIGGLGALGRAGDAPQSGRGHSGKGDIGIAFGQPLPMHSPAKLIRTQIRQLAGNAGE